MKKLLFVPFILFLLWPLVSYGQQLDLTWDHDGLNTDGYHLERGPNSTTFSALTTLNGNTARSYSDTGLQPATQYCYRVNAFNVSGNSPWSNVACGVTKAPLSVTLAGTGQGHVTSNPAGIDCGSNCSAMFDGNSIVTITAAASAGSVFSGWSGACSGTAVSCAVTMNAAKTVTATFDLLPVPSTPVLHLTVH